MIMLVDDLHDDVTLVTMALTKAGVTDTVHVACAGDEVIEYLNGDGIYADRSRFPFPTLMLLDLKMPRVSGFDVLRWMKDNPKLPYIHVVVLSASDRPDDMKLASDLGAKSYFVKSVRFSDMQRLANELKAYCVAPGAVPGQEPLPPTQSMPPRKPAP